jgi:Zn-dependent peptidase ImmA (M78 family)
MNRVHVKPDLLRWARERADLSVEALERKFPKLPAWERGDVQPTLKQLEGFAKATFTPIGFLFLQEAPVERVPIPDSRTVGNVHLGHPTPDLLDTVYTCQQRQDWYREFARSTGAKPLDFVGSVRCGDDVVETARKMREALAFDVEERRRIRTWTDALRQFIAQADDLGILVMVSGVVGSNNRRRLNAEEFRGFAMVDPLAPLVFINGADTKAAQMFTLAHELAHIWLGQSAVTDSQAIATPDHEVERWCNRVAAELLVPLASMKREYHGGADLRGELDRLARHFKVSTLVILRRVHDAGGITRDELWRAYERELERLRSMPRGEGGDFYLTLGARASKRFARALVTATLEGRTSFTETFRLLGVKKMATFAKLGKSLGVGS